MTAKEFERELIERCIVSICSRQTGFNRISRQALNTLADVFEARKLFPIYYYLEFEQLIKCTYY